jgi:PhzF family phenazine biosynthesis protein
MRQWTIDAFASGPFKGNPACVVEPLDAWPSTSWMQALAAENNQAETSFLLKTADPARFGLRWFTPAMEAPLCGHATLAAAHVLFEELGAEASLLTFDTLAGPLTVRRDSDRLEMDFPADPPRQTSVPDGLAEALGVEPIEVWAGAYLIAVLRDEATVRALKPDLAALNRIEGEASGGPGQTVVVALADAGHPIRWSVASLRWASAFRKIRPRARPTAS